MTLTAIEQRIIDKRDTVLESTTQCGYAKIAFTVCGTRCRIERSGAELRYHVYTLGWRRMTFDGMAEHVRRFQF
jgi:hypothetical protein